MRQCLIRLVSQVMNVMPPWQDAWIDFCDGTGQDNLPLGTCISKPGDKLEVDALIDHAIVTQPRPRYSLMGGMCIGTVKRLLEMNQVNAAREAIDIGVPLPFYSYGGSSFWAFTILLFIFIKMDANKVNEW